MQIQRIISKSMLPIAVTAMTCLCVSQAKAATLSDKFEPKDNKTEVVIGESKNPNKVENESESGFPWMHVISLGILAVFGGVCALGKYLDKNLDEREVIKNNQTEVADNNS